MFLGRIAPLKGTHLAIDIARRTGLPLKIAGEIQPPFREYWEHQVAPYVDGRQIQYVGEADFAAKNELLAHARAMLFPIQWDEPFGLTTIEAMVSGTPVLATRRGALPEIVTETSGALGDTLEELVSLRPGLDRLDPEAIRANVLERFTHIRMAEDYVRIYREELERSQRL